MSDVEVNEELIQLREAKQKLVNKAIELKKKYDAWEKAEGRGSGRTQKNFVPEKSLFGDLFPGDNEVSGVNKKRIAISSFMMGIKFNAVDKKWISDHEYLYTANVKSKTLEFFLEVTVDVKDTVQSPEILGIVCQFVNVRKCYSLEITPWVHRFTEARDTANLFSAISDYTEHNVTRTKILRKFQHLDIATAQECTEDDGGVMILLHAKNNSDFVYLEIRWVLRFVESLWQIDNFFVIQQISAGEDFLAANSELLESFCKYRINKDHLQELWDKLCSAIEKDETSQPITETSTSSILL